MIALDSTQSLFFSTCSASLIHAALEKVAHRDGMMLYELMALPVGSERRRFHDDITCTVVIIRDKHKVTEVGTALNTPENETCITLPSSC